MPVTSKLAKTIAEELNGQIYYKDSTQYKGKWYRTGFRENTNRGYEVGITESQARLMIGDVLGENYQRDSGYTQSDLNACIKFLQMFLLK